ncbi:unnamed protein product [Cylicostephanus goldi]|uniref:Neurotransmitter-gated ion-channel transmembrane domain-containing protein n=1 Tax=Cylicostephanus goldi TaxID=71465 RepID=A0A3P6SN83_CYLGO|nr:unnamed protein product [Cylicostephanus goldi]
MFRIPQWLEVLGFDILAPVFGSGSTKKRKQSSKKMNNGTVRLDLPTEDLISKEVVDHVGEEQELEELLARWSQLANIFDRLFFTMILFLNTITTILLLLLAPNMGVPNMYERQWEL